MESQAEAPDVAVTAIASLTDPAKLVILTGERWSRPLPRRFGSTATMAITVPWSAIPYARKVKARAIAETPRRSAPMQSTEA